jgi:RNA polymerase sigma-70 factor (ECF subfamily)
MCRRLELFPLPEHYSDSSAHVATDEHLMLEAGRGSREAFGQLFERYREPIWRFFRRRVGDPAQAEELAHDTFLAVLEGSRRYEPRAPFKAYLFGTAYNVLMADRRKTRPTTQADGDPPAPGPNLDAALWVRAALQQLGPGEREIVMLREYEQLSYDEIAGVLRIPLNTVRSRLFRARLALRAALLPEGRANEVKT